MKSPVKLSSEERRAAIIKAVRRVFAEKGFHGTTTRALADAGEAVPSPVLPNLGGWFTHHLAATLMLYLLPTTPVVDYGVDRQKLVEQAVWFTLRGMGLKEKAIERHYNPKALALFDN